MSEDREAKRGDLYLFERLFVIGCENNSDCDIAISLSLKTRNGGGGGGGKGAKQSVLRSFRPQTISPATKSPPRSRLANNE